MHLSTRPAPFSPCRIAGLGLALLALATHASATTICEQKVNLVGQALRSGHCTMTLPVDLGGAGAVWRRQAIDPSQSFRTTYKFRLSPTSGSPMADGVALVIQAAGNTALGTGGGYLGMPTPNVGAVVQTWFNNRIGLTLDGDPYTAPAAPADLGSAALVTGEMTVEYVATSHVLSMFGILKVDGKSFGIADYREVDLKALLGHRAWIGFSGGTGGGTATQTVTDWTFSP